MTVLLIDFVLLSSVIVVAGVFLTRFADRVARLTGLGHSLAGVLLLASATSLPELSVGWSAVRIGAADLAVGELLGSCLWNLLILSVLDLGTRSRGRILGRESATQALIANVSVLLVSLVVIGIVVDYPGVILRIGPFSWCIVIAYLLSARLIYNDHRASAPIVKNDGDTAAGLATAIAVYLACVLVIFLAAPRLAIVADQIGEFAGISETFIGASLVGLVTSLPEVVTTVAALRMGNIEMAVANIFGSNGFNLLILATLDLATPESLLAIASEAQLITAGAVILTTTTAVLGLLYRTEKRYWLIEPDAALVIVLIISAMLLVYYVAEH